MRYFENGNRVNQDACALEVRNNENQSITDYNTFNFYNADGSCEEVTDKVKKFSTEYPNLTFRIGYGVASSCTIDNDSKVRLGSDMTHGPERQTLCVRNFVASPNLAKGEGIPNLEMILLTGENTLEKADCHKVAESEFAVFAPMANCVENYVKGASLVIDDDIRIGKPSKEIFIRNRQTCK